MKKKTRTHSALVSTQIHNRLNVRSEVCRTKGFNCMMQTALTSIRLAPSPDLTRVERRNGPGRLVGTISLFKLFTEHLGGKAKSGLYTVH